MFSGVAQSHFVIRSDAKSMLDVLICIRLDPFFYSLAACYMWWKSPFEDSLVKWNEGETSLLVPSLPSKFYIHRT